MGSKLSSHQLSTLAITFLLLLGSVTAQDRIEMKCNPSLRHRYEHCPTGYCCVRDEFLPTFVYCRKFGSEDDNCTTRDTESECPCSEGLRCRANIQGKFPSVYGRCVVNVTTTVATTATTISSTTPATIINTTVTADITGNNFTTSLIDNTTATVLTTTAAPEQNTTMVIDNSTASLMPNLTKSTETTNVTDVMT
ncbi:hypothetical protein PoB_001228900 [Plakobranchus ocellatus]|uniref:Uncharacterized protein n=1 Tax=Plakobranchus ocellatus TaxID=259542 RepID=A0AAV3YRU5_9GAST|nr:hypothetical protein PoB_001228900 [Plakobranchus ocellatus]